MGTLCVIDQQPRTFSEHEIVILQTFAKLVIGELELRTIAFTDGLTNLLSRKAWKDRVEAEIDRATRHCAPLAILMVDLDHFKKVNDTYGHDVGDLVLLKTTEAIKTELRKHDLAGRIGGEEFAVCLIEASEHAGLAAAERIRQQIAALQFPDHEHLSCSASIGVTVFETGASLDELLKRADLALYAAKQAGRNQVQMG